jgi:hypothetical protein
MTTIDNHSDSRSRRDKETYLKFLCHSLETTHQTDDIESGRCHSNFFQTFGKPTGCSGCNVHFNLMHPTSETNQWCVKCYCKKYCTIEHQKVHILMFVLIEFVILFHVMLFLFNATSVFHLVILLLEMVSIHRYRKQIIFYKSSIIRNLKGRKRVLFSTRNPSD